MTVPMPTFAADPNAVPKSDPLGNIMRGYKLAQMPAQLRAQQQLQQAQVQKQQMANQYYPQVQQQQLDEMQARTQGEQQSNLFAPYLNQARLDLMRAQAQKAQQGPDPLSGLSGNASTAAHLQKLAAAAQQNPSLMPIYNSAKQAFDQDLQNQQALNKYRSTLISYAGQRYGSPLAKLNAEMNDIQQGYLPGTNQSVKISPEEQEILSNEYGNRKLKITTNPTVARQALAYNNLAKSLSLIDPITLTKYSGIPGGVSKGLQKVESQFNMESPDYDEYLKNRTYAVAAAKQYRQTLFDSVSHQNQKKLESLTDPSTWDKNPKQAYQQLLAFDKIAQLEGPSFSSALQTPKAYYANTSPQNNVSRGTSAPKSTSKQDLYDKYGHMTLAQLQAALAQAGGG